jgi:uncharacterized low-complexity protein
MRITLAAALVAAIAVGVAAPATAVTPTAPAAPQPTGGGQRAAPAPAHGSSGSGGGTSGGVVIGVGLVGLAVGAAGALLLRRRPAAAGAPDGGSFGSVAALPPQPAAAPGPGIPPQALIRACIEVADQVGSEMLRERLHGALAEAGVRPVAVDGQRFDGRLHRAVGTVPTDDARYDGTIAATQRLGWSMGDRPLRLPDVVVFRARGA